MASASDNLMTMIDQPYWRFRTPTYGDNPWSNLSADMMFFTSENETVLSTTTLHNHETISNSSSPIAIVSSSQYYNGNDNVLRQLEMTTNIDYSGGAVFQTPTGSDSDGHVSTKQQKPTSLVGPSTGRVTKRKPRASKRQSTTTFITADPTNFRQMVQQVTGVRFGSGVGLDADVAHVLKPEAHRLGGGLAPSSAFDGSGFLLGGGSVSASASLGQPRLLGGSGAVDFDSFGSFPTLESSKV